MGNNKKLPEKSLAEFFGLKFKTKPDVFVPYKESAALVERVIKINPTGILDLGTGCGNIAITLAKSLPEAKIVATDVSEKAIELAKENSIIHNVESRIKFTKSDLITKISYPPEVIITNIPFVPESRVYLLESKDQSDKSITISGGEDGFDLYRKLFIQMIHKNFYPKILIGEIDYTQRLTAVLEAQKFFPKCVVNIDTDRKFKIIILTILF